MNPANDIANAIAASCERIVADKGVFGVTLRFQDRNDFPQRFFGDEASGTGVEVWQYGDDEILLTEQGQNHRHYRATIDRDQCVEKVVSWYESEIENVQIEERT